ncbi:MAG: hypothetical protein KKE62_01400 [Proteobacteria bacterium]|nr:hypothetical protein [Pseudomonadota bacterium]MBU1541475.1 hypothetical protein [Pseudomonadota bacterium]MBU2431858.1 hypothetical protein [Pseudomonadota bacterium]MBU2480311.1 hypothetical protein [Pseudomonadota bacterium]
MNKILIIIFCALILFGCNDQKTESEMKAQIVTLQQQNAILATELSECKKQKIEPVLKNTNKVDLKNNKPLVFE